MRLLYTDNFESDPFFTLGLALGCDFQVFYKNLYLVSQLDITIACPGGREREVELSDDKYEERYNNVLFKVGLGYKVY